MLEKYEYGRPLPAHIYSLLDLQGDADYFYVASVYTQDPEGPEHAFDNASKAGAWLVKQGVHVMVPIAHSHPISRHLPKELNTHDVWMKQDFPLVANAKGIILVEMPGFEKSKGMTMEAAWCKAWGKPTFRLSWPLPKEVV